MDSNKVYFIGAGPGDPELITVKGKQILETSKTILYTGSLIPEKVLMWAPNDCLKVDSQSMSYKEIFLFYQKHIVLNNIVRLHTGDPSIYSTIAKQIQFLNQEGILYEIIPGVTAAFGVAASYNIEYTIPGVSQTLIITRLEGQTPNPENLETLLRCKNSSLVFYLSTSLIDKLVSCALKLGYEPDTPCWVIEKVTWPEEQIIKGSLNNICERIKETGVYKTALILLGTYLNQEEKESSKLYN